MSCLCPCFRSYYTAGPTSGGGMMEKLLPQVVLDHSYCGEDAVLVKGASRICGTGGALANAPLMQDKAYWEVKVQTEGVWGLGLAARQCALSTMPLGQTKLAWVLRSDGAVYHNGAAVAKLPDRVVIDEGDTIGCSYDHIELLFYLNGTRLDIEVTQIRGSVYPVASVDQGAILDVSFVDFEFNPPNGYSEVMIEREIT